MTEHLLRGLYGAFTFTTRELHVWTWWRRRVVGGR